MSDGKHEKRLRGVTQDARGISLPDIRQSLLHDAQTNQTSKRIASTLGRTGMSLNPQWQKAISRLPPGEFAEGGFWSHLEQALKLMNNDKNSAPQRQHGARDILYLFKAFVAYSLRDRKRPDHLLMSYRALLPIINEHAGVTWAKLALDELDAEEVDLVLDAARRLTIER